MSKRKMSECFYGVDHRSVNIALGLQFRDDEDDFEDVTFLVDNCDDIKKAIKRVEGFVRLLVEEFFTRT